MVQPQFKTPIVGVTTTPPVFDSSMYLEELPLRESTREIIRRGWPWYMVELGGGVRTVTAQMLDERTNQELLEIPGLARTRLYEIRKAIRQDPGVISSLFPNISREEAYPALRGAFPEQVEQRFDAEGRPRPTVGRDDITPSEPEDGSQPEA